jgi:hypothetical protein
MGSGSSVATVTVEMFYGGTGLWSPVGDAGVSRRASERVWDAECRTSTRLPRMFPEHAVRTGCISLIPGI